MGANIVYHLLKKNIFLFFLIFGCSPYKNNFFSKHYFGFKTRYNTLFNAEHIFENALKNLEKKEILKDRLYDLEIFSDKEHKILKKAEEKVVKAIHKNKQYKNVQFFKAYFLLGKIRYFSGRFAPALEAFSEMIYQNVKGKMKNIAKIWIAKTKIKLHDEKNALRILKTLKLPKNAEMQKTLFLAYQNLGNQKNAMKHLKKYANLTKKNERAKIILSQMYHRQKNKQKAKEILEQMILKNTTAKYKILAFYKILKYLKNEKELEKTKKQLQNFSKKLDYLPYENNIKTILKNL